jgi:hypothetical protein
MTKLRVHACSISLDEVHLALSPLLLGSGEHLLGGLDLLKLGYRCAEHVPTLLATHVIIRKD